MLAQKYLNINCIGKYEGPGHKNISANISAIGANGTNIGIDQRHWRQDRHVISGISADQH